MKRARVFLLTGGGADLLPMEETPYGREIVIQELLEGYPDLLPGDQISPDNPRRWLLVTGEMSVPDEVAGAGRWSLDHLFLDQEGIPTFVECKRAADTRGRREVIAQMLDYAANGIEYWSMDRLRQAATQTAIRRGSSLHEEVRRLVRGEPENDPEEYWRSVEQNLSEGKVRLVFVAEETSKELRRLVEFLNEKLDGIEVLAVEIKQFLAGQQKVLVPRVVGLTEAIRARKSNERKGKRKTNRSEFLGKCTPAAADVFKAMLESAEKRRHIIYWGEQGFSIRALLPDQVPFSFAYGYPPDRFEFYLGDLPVPEEAATTLRSKLLAFEIFSPAGKSTLRTVIDEAISSRLVDDVSRVMFDEIEAIVRSHEPAST